jgi:hypothetical protein
MKKIGFAERGRFSSNSMGSGSVIQQKPAPYVMRGGRRFARRRRANKEAEPPFRFNRNGGSEHRLLAILLDSGRTQSGKAMLIDRELPGKEFVDGQRVAAAGFLKGEQAAADCGNDFGLTANNPPFGTGCG